MKMPQWIYRFFARYKIQRSKAATALIDGMPWWLYRLFVRYRMWKNSGPDLNRRSEVEEALIKGATTGAGVSAEQCGILAKKLGTHL